jgi:nucleoside-diphosphate-sugar epimerase
MNVEAEASGATLRGACDPGSFPDRVSPTMGASTNKRLVIFGCGYVGAAVARWATSTGLQVTALTRNSATAVLLRETGVSAVVADLASDAWHDHIAGAPDFALNCVSSGGGGADAYRHSYIGGMTSILTWARSRGPVGTFLYTSSTSVYGQGGGAFVDETMPTVPATDRAGMLLETEWLLRNNVGATGRWFVLRLAGIYGPGRHHLLDQVRAGEVAGAADHHLNLIHRDDIATAIAAGFAAPSTTASHVLNVVDDGSTRKSEIVTWLAERLGVPVPRFTGEPMGGRRAVTPDRVILNSRIKAVLGWNPRYSTFREGYANLLSR